MFVFLPDDVTSNMTLLEESLTAEFVQDLSMTLLPAKVSLSLPVLRFSFSTDLLPLLGELGESKRSTCDRCNACVPAHIYLMGSLQSFLFNHRFTCLMTFSTWSSSGPHLLLVID